MRQTILSELKRIIHEEEQWDKSHDIDPKFEKRIINAMKKTWKQIAPNYRGEPMSKYDVIHIITNRDEEQIKEYGELTSEDIDKFYKLDRKSIIRIGRKAFLPYRYEN